MGRFLDKLVVFTCCAAVCAQTRVDAGGVAALCIAVTASSLFEAVADAPCGRIIRPALPALYLVAAACVPAAAPAAPLAIYDALRMDDIRGNAWRSCAAVVCALALARVLAVQMQTGPAALLTLLSLAAAMLSLRSTQIERITQRQRRIRDELQGRSLALEAKNRDLAERADYEARVATLAERARIAREMHDTVGHILTRACLQVEALRIVHVSEPGTAADFTDVKSTLDEALTCVRASVHELRDDAVSLSVQLQKIADEVAHDTQLHVDLEILCDRAPTPVALCFAAVLRESLSNALRHSDADRAMVRCMDQPGFYQLSVRDNGTTKSPGSATARPGMGLTSMRERVEALGGTFTAGAEPRGSWRVFASIPKEGIS